MYFPVLLAVPLLGMPDREYEIYELLLLPAAVVFILCKMRASFAGVIAFETIILIFSLALRWHPRRKFFSVILFIASATQVVLLLLGHWILRSDG